MSNEQLSGRAESRERFEKWIKEQPRCAGYPWCYGNLPSVNHVASCPLQNVKDSAGKNTTFTYYDAWQAGERAKESK